MRVLIYFLLMIFSWNLLADDIRIEVNPTKPVIGEVFQAYFRIFTSSDEEPSINFTPSNMELVGKTNQGVSTRTVYANGKLTVTRELTIVYDFVASKEGFSALRDIRVEIGGQTLKHPTVNIKILKEAEQLADVFVIADIPKKNLFIGEGVIVRYYLYHRTPFSNLDIKKYPKLNGFLKRFLQEPERTERVSVDGQIFMRTQIYAAKLYPEKTGMLKVDSLRLSATYPRMRQGDPFGAFGLNRDMTTRTIYSEVIKLQVNPLPAPAPADFTGLVGKHTFELQTGQTRLIVNEPLEVKLTVSGEGALENLEAPVLIKNPALEEFETNGDLKISSPDQATKTFDYTFLAKENLNLPGKEVSFSYFDPSTEKYISTNLTLPEIVIAGGQGRRETTESPKVEKNQTSPSPSIGPKELQGPTLSQTTDWRRWLPYINLSLALIAILISLGWLLRHQKLSWFKRDKDIPAVFRKGDFQMSEFVKWMTPLIRESGKAPGAIIKEAPLNEETKRYFIDLLSANDYKEYSSQKSQMDYKYRPAYFKELGKYIESRRDGNS